MLELLALLGIVVVGAVLFGVAALIWGLLKLVFKIALIPVSLAFAAIKIVLVLLATIVGVVVIGPVALVLGLLLLIPLLIIAAIVWAGVTAVSAVV